MGVGRGKGEACAFAKALARQDGATWRTKEPENLGSTRGGLFKRMEPTAAMNMQMTQIKFLGVIFLVMALPMMAADSAKLALPSRSQVEWQNAGIGIFVHWAPNVYQGTEGDDLSTPRASINPDRFDAHKIAAAAKSANAGYLIFVAKHVGGYCAWQTDTTDYSLKTSPWKNGRGDMVGELAKLEYD